MALRRQTRLAAIVLVVAGIGLSACSSDDDGRVTASNTTTTAPTTATPTTASTTVPGPTTTTAGHAAHTPTVAAFSFTGGKVTGDSRVTVKLGDQVTIRVVSDVAEEVHIHTFDLKVELEPNVTGEVTFTADIPGVHEVELEDSALHLTSLEVQ